MKIITKDQWIYKSSDVMTQMPLESSAQELVYRGFITLFDVVDKDNDVFKPNCFGLYDNKQIRLQYEHNKDCVIGDIYIRQTKVGYRATAKIDLCPEYSKAAYVIKLIKKGYLNGFSVGAIAKTVNRNRHGGYDIVEAQLQEVSMVFDPAVSQARFKTYRSINNG